MELAFLCTNGALPKLFPLKTRRNLLWIPSRNFPAVSKYIHYYTPWIGTRIRYLSKYVHLIKEKEFNSGENRIIPGLK